MKPKGYRGNFTLTAGETPAASAHIWRLRVTSRHLNWNLDRSPPFASPLNWWRSVVRVGRSRALLKSVARGGPPHFAGHYSSLRVIPTARCFLFSWPFHLFFLAPRSFLFLFLSLLSPLHSPNFFLLVGRIVSFYEVVRPSRIGWTRSFDVSVYLCLSYLSLVPSIWRDSARK